MATLVTLRNPQGQQENNEILQNQTDSKNAKTVTWAALGGIQGVRKEEPSRVVSQIYLRKRAGCTHVAFREKAKCTIEMLERTRGDLTAHT